MEGPFEQIASRLEYGERVFLALVVHHTDHSPGTAGSKMAVFEDGETCGTIGGGIMERRVQELGSRALLLADFDARREVLVHRADVPQASGLVCAGEQTNVYLRLAPDDLGVARRIVAATTGDTPDRPPTWLLITPDGLELSKQEPESHHADGASWSYAESLINPRRLLILGGGHCALALSKVAREAGFHVTVADDRANLDTLGKNHAAHRRLSVRDLADAAGHIAYPESTSVVAMGTDIASDLRSLYGALRGPFPFIGLMGAPAKISRVRQALADSGFGPEALSRITAPVGLPIGSRTPQEIAISVTAQLIQRHRLTGPAV